MLNMARIIVTSAIMAAFAQPAQAAETFVLDPTHTSILFAVPHLGFSKVYGRFNTMEGTFTLDAEAPEKSSVVVTIDAASLDTNDKERDKHMRGEDFFDVARYPTLSYKSTEVKLEGDKAATVTGDLTMHGVTKPVPLKVTLVGTGPHPMDKAKTIAGFSARGTLKRSDFGMGYGVPVLGDDVELIIEVEAIRQP